MSTLDDPGLILRSVDLLGTHRREIAADFYVRLFDRHPQLRVYFAETNSTSRERMFVTALRHMMLAADSPEDFERHGRELAARHRQYQIQPDHFFLVVDVLLDTLAAHSGPAWTADIEDAWRTVATRTATILAEGSASEDGHTSSEHAA